MEQWKWVKGYEGIYEVSNLGRMRSYRVPGCHGPTAGRLRAEPRFLKPIRQSNGYCKVNFQRDGKHQGFWYHRLLAQTFIPNPNNLPQVNHINGIKADNRLENLEWVTHEGNRQHAGRLGLIRHNPNRGEKHTHSKLSNDEVLEIRRAYKAGVIQAELARRYPNISKSTINLVVRRKAWKHLAEAA
jgi:hypothetical protein